MPDTTTPDGHCLSGPHCRASTGNTGYPTSDPLCYHCLAAAEPDVRALIYDYLDLAQLHETSLSQAINQRVSGGSPEAPMPIAGHVDELQAEILHVTALWEYELRVVCQLADPYVSAPIANWHTTLTKPTPLAKVRPGAAVQRAVNVIAPRLGRLAALPVTLVCPTGVEDQPLEVAGWEAVHQLQQLHRRARAMLGRTTRRFWIPGTCWACDAHPRGVDGPLYRSEPRHQGDPMQVHCSTCAASRPYPDYERYMTALEWPELEVAA